MYLQIPVVELSKYLFAFFALRIFVLDILLEIGQQFVQGFSLVLGTALSQNP